MQKDKLVKEVEGVFILYSEKLKKAERKVVVNKIINDPGSVVRPEELDKLAIDVLKELFDKQEKGEYVRDITKVPEGYNHVLHNIESHITISHDRPEIKKMEGINESMLYIGTKGSHTATHIEDQNLCSLNILLEGSPKLWYVVDSSMRATLTKKFAQHLKEHKNDECCPQALEHKVYTVTPKLLKEWGIPYKIVLQHPGDLFFIRSGTYHTVVNMGRNTAEAINIGSDLWNANYDPPPCSCDDNKRREVPKNRSITYAPTASKKILRICQEPNCNRRFLTLKKLRNHEKRSHAVEELFSCADCLKSFSRRRNLIRHLREHNANLLQCTVCGKWVKDMKQHNNYSHSADRPTCPKCGKLIRKKNYNRHSESCQKQCIICNKNFSSQRYLTQHINKVHKDK